MNAQNAKSEYGTANANLGLAHAFSFANANLIEECADAEFAMPLAFGILPAAWHPMNLGHYLGQTEQAYQGVLTA